MGVVRASKTSLPLYQNIRRHIPEEYYSSTSLPEAQQSVSILRWTRSPDVVMFRRWVPSIRLSAALRINCPHSINKWPRDASRHHDICTTNRKERNVPVIPQTDRHVRSASGKKELAACKMGLRIYLYRIMTALH
jgi:hypothetical protein